MTTQTRSAKHQKLTACLLGAAVGDAIGLPYEGLSPRRATRLRRLPLQHRFMFGYGMVSDDTDHSIFVMQSLLISQGNVSVFRNALAWRLRWWLLCFPAGIGMATLKSIIKLWFGCRQSGVYSAGNGPSMRSAVIGVVLAHDAVARRAFVQASTELTHTDPLALAGALAIAEIAARITTGEWAVRPGLSELTQMLAALSSLPAWQQAILHLQASCAADEPIMAARIHFGGNKGVSGYALHSVPFSIVAWYNHLGDYEKMMESIVSAGGDVDTVAAMAGALMGLSVGELGVPKQWVAGIIDWPHSMAYLRELAQTVGDDEAKIKTSVPQYSAAKLTFHPMLVVRGLIFTIVVLVHGFRRLLPPF